MNFSTSLPKLAFFPSKANKLKQQNKQKKQPCKQINKLPNKQYLPESNVIISLTFHDLNQYAQREP